MITCTASVPKPPLLKLFSWKFPAASVKPYLVTVRDKGE